MDRRAAGCGVGADRAAEGRSVLLDGTELEWPDATFMTIELQSDVASEVIRVLVVDDDPSMQRLLSRFIQDGGYDIRCAAGVAGALQNLADHAPHVVITDLVMQDMDGIELCRAIRNNEAIGFIYVIVLSACTHADDMVAAFDAGANEFLVKPVDRRVLTARLRAAKRIIDLQRRLDKRSLQLHLTNAKLASLNDRLCQLATTDELTTLPNRREAMNRLAEQWSATARRSEPLACMAVDIDHFKSVNDRDGHEAGDAVLKSTAEVLRRSARLGETVFRFGGEEFLILCPNATADSASVGAERIRKAVAENTVPTDHGLLGVSISVGVAERSSAMEGPEALLKEADDALYSAKRGGRNRVHVAKRPVEGVVRSESSMPPRRDGGQGEAARHRVDGRFLVISTGASNRDLCAQILSREGFQVVGEVRTKEPSAGMRSEATNLLVVPDNDPAAAQSLLEKLRCARTAPDTTVVVVGSNSDGDVELIFFRRQP